MDELEVKCILPPIPEDPEEPETLQAIENEGLSLLVEFVNKGYKMTAQDWIRGKLEVAKMLEYVAHQSYRFCNRGPSTSSAMPSTSSAMPISNEVIMEKLNKLCTMVEDGFCKIDSRLRNIEEKQRTQNVQHKTTRVPRQRNASQSTPTEELTQKISLTSQMDKDETNGVTQTQGMTQNINSASEFDGSDDNVGETQENPQNVDSIPPKFHDINDGGGGLEDHVANTQDNIQIIESTSEFHDMEDGGICSDDLEAETHVNIDSTPEFHDADGGADGSEDHVAKTQENIHNIDSTHEVNNDVYMGSQTQNIIRGVIEELNTEHILGKESGECATEPIHDGGLDATEEEDNQFGGDVLEELNTEHVLGKESGECATEIALMDDVEVFFNNDWRKGHVRAILEKHIQVSLHYSGEVREFTKEGVRRLQKEKVKHDSVAYMPSYLQLGAAVETRVKDMGAWHPGTVLGLHVAGDSPKVDFQFKSVYTDTAGTILLRLRLQPSELRPIPPLLSDEVNYKCLKIGTTVDIFQGGAWFSGVLKEVKGNGKFGIQGKSHDTIVEYEANQIRRQRDWINGVWELPVEVGSDKKKGKIVQTPTFDLKCFSPPKDFLELDDDQGVAFTPFEVAEKQNAVKIEKGRISMPKGEKTLTPSGVMPSTSSISNGDVSQSTSNGSLEIGRSKFAALPIEAVQQSNMASEQTSKFIQGTENSSIFPCKLTSGEKVIPLEEPKNPSALFPNIFSSPAATDLLNQNSSASADIKLEKTSSIAFGTSEAWAKPTELKKTAINSASGAESTASTLNGSIFSSGANAVSIPLNNDSLGSNLFGAANAQTGNTGSGTTPSTQSVPFQFGSSASSPSFGVSGNTSLASNSSPFGFLKSELEVSASSSTPQLSSTISSGSSSSTMSSPLFGTNWQAPNSAPNSALVFSSSFTTSSTPTFSFGGSSATSGSSTAAPTFSFGGSYATSGSSTAAPMFGAPTNTPSSAPIFGFSSTAPTTPQQPVFGNSAPSVTPSQSLFGNSTPGFAFGAPNTNGINNNQQVSMEDSMAEDTDQANKASVAAPMFGQAAVSMPQPNFAFGGGAATLPPMANPFQFGGQPMAGTPHNVNPFQASQNLEFQGGGRFLLGSTGGGNKAGRRIFKAKKTNRKK